MRDEIGGYQQQQQWGSQPQGNEAPPTQPNAVVNPGAGRPDYSLQWAEYYRSLGMHREAEMIEQQAKTKAANPVSAALPQVVQTTSAPAPTPAAAPSAASQPDYSPQWAEYYCSIGKHKEAEAIEAQMKNKTSVPQPGAAAPGVAPTPAGPQAAGGYQQQAYGAYQPPATGYYGRQPQAAPVPGGVPQGGYRFPSYGYGGGQAGGLPDPQDN